MIFSPQTRLYVNASVLRHTVNVVSADQQKYANNEIRSSLAIFPRKIHTYYFYILCIVQLYCKHDGFQKKYKRLFSCKIYSVKIKFTLKVSNPRWENEEMFRLSANVINTCVQL